jgi:16S rRNA (adenine(1408)-N(1))-methyltransferase
MRILHGTKVTEAPPGWRDILAGQRVVIDLGSGDGRWAYESAKADAASFYIAIDPDAEALAEYAFKASRKPARGGIRKALFVVASVEHLPTELTAVAHVVRVNFPWGGLLRGLIEPQPSVLAGLASLIEPGGRFEIVVAYVPEYDPNAFAGDALAALDDAGIEALKPPYAAAGLQIKETQRLTQDDALAIASTWGRRLLHARPRPVFFIGGTRLE